jgi:hypothetical protein
MKPMWSHGRLLRDGNHFARRYIAMAQKEHDTTVIRTGGGGAGWFIAAVLAVILLLGGYFLLTGGVFETQRSVDIDVQLPAAEGQQ